MASNLDASDSSFSDFSDTDTDSHSDSQSSSDSDQGQAESKTKQKACQYYNDGHCRYGKRCRDLHVCKYFLKGFCRYESACKLKHISDSSTEEKDRGRLTHRKKRSGCRDRSRSPESVEDNGRPYRWQLDMGEGWEDVAHDYILEAQYSQPNNKGIRIYNTPCGALSIDFTRMRILKKTKLRVRRKDSPQTEWLWHYRGNQGWSQYGEQDSKSKASSVSSYKLEREYQKNRKGTVKFNVNSTIYEIRFKDMCQNNLTTGHRRKIRRRPKYEPPQGGIISSMKNAIKSLSLSSSTNTPVWQFSGHGEHWHTFKKSNSCSMSSEDIEVEYQHNPQGSIRFTVNEKPYLLDFSRMRQTNETINVTRKIRRVLQ
ncbi:protein mono-ADP-ribosyltransferase PARP12 [Electrophorus electricus]|uniref:protein mono-ADP-ribosyltransferase PARP12 n=1 Tax=Electrophorus electricus TaxID=8005 RepID=UPI0015D0722A|nr:protein mono-ADP-ribosyltransferase PARP12 [Electrophorus electricus]